jgi:hypothetical protein
MGQQQSTDGLNDAQSPFDSIPAEHRAGWKVLSVASQSPSGGKGLVPYFSVLTHINGERLGESESALVPLIREGADLRCTFLNLSTLQTREVNVTPARGPHHEGLLGLMIRWDRFSNAHLETIHCLEVHHGSEHAGLRAHSSAAVEWIQSRTEVASTSNKIGEQLKLVSNIDTRRSFDR